MPMTYEQQMAMNDLWRDFNGRTARHTNDIYGEEPKWILCDANILNGMKCVWIDEQAYLNYMNALNVTIYTDGVITIFRE
jgi:hypothetical protein